MQYLWLGTNIILPGNKRFIVQFFIPGGIFVPALKGFDRKGKELFNYKLQLGYGEVIVDEFDTPPSTYVLFDGDQALVQRTWNPVRKVEGDK